jgi:hypothetical protein
MGCCKNLRHSFRIGVVDDQGERGGGSEARAHEEMARHLARQNLGLTCCSFALHDDKSINRSSCR